jgi:hypothetical protein
MFFFCVQILLVEGTVGLRFLQPFFFHWLLFVVKYTLSKPFAVSVVSKESIESLECVCSKYEKYI